MYCAYSMEEVTRTEFGGYKQTGYSVLKYQVVLVKERPTWKLINSFGPWWPGSSLPESLRRAKRNARKAVRNDIPFLNDAAPNKLLTGKQAVALTGVQNTLAALDYLRDRLEADSDNADLENYQKPPKEKPAKPAPEPKRPPTKLEIAQAKLAKARAIVDKWEQKAAHANKKAKDWTREANRLAKRCQRLTVAEASAT